MEEKEKKVKKVKEEKVEEKINDDVSVLEKKTDTKEEVVDLFSNFSKKKEKTDKSILKIVRKNKLYFIIGGVILLLLIVALIIYNVFVKEKYIEYPILYLENEQLVLWQKGSDEKIIVDDDFSEEDNRYLDMVYANNTNNLFAYLDDDSLYIYNVKKATNERVSSDVGDNFIFTEDDKYLVYESSEGTIYSYDIKEKMKNKVVSVSEEDDEYVSIDGIIGSKVVYHVVTYGKDYDDRESVLYIKDLSSDSSAKVITKDSAGCEFFEDKNKIFYAKENDEDSMSLYVYNIKKDESEKLLSGIDYLLSYSDDFNEFMYVSKSNDEVKILDDDEFNNDPVTTVTEKKLCTYSYYIDGYCTRDQWLYDEYIDITTTTSKKSINDEIREAVDDLTYYNVYIYKDGKSEKIVSNALEIYVGNYENKTVVYETLNTDKQVKISTLKSLDDFEKYLTNATDIWYKVGSEKAVSFANISEFGVEEIVISKDKGIYMVNDDEELYYLDANKKDSKLVLLDNDIYYLLDDETDYGIAYAIREEDEDFYDLKIVSGKEVKEVAFDINDVSVSKDGNLYIMNDCSENFCSYSLYDGKLKNLANDVYDVVRLTSKEFYIFKNYSTKNETYDLYRYSDGELIQIAFDIPEGYTSVYSIEIDD